MWTGLTMTLKPIRPTWMDSVNRPYNETEPHQTNLDGQCEQALQWYWNHQTNLDGQCEQALQWHWNPSDQLGWTVWTGLTMILNPIRPTWMDSVNRPYNDTEPHQTNLDGQCEQALQWYWNPSDQLGWTVWTGLTMTLKPIRPTWMDSVNRPYNDTEPHQTNLDGQCEQALQWYWNPSDQLGWTVWTGLTMILKPIRPTWMDSVNRPYNDIETHQTNSDGQCEQALQWYWNPSDQLGWTVWTGLTMTLKPIRPTWMDSVNRPYNDTEPHQTNLDGQCEQALQWYWNPSDQLGWTVWTGLTMILNPIRPTWMDSVNRPYNDTETHQTNLDGQCEQALQWHWDPSNQLGWTVWTGLTMTLNPIRPTWMDSVNRPYNDTETHQTNLDGQCEQALQWHWTPSNQLGWTVWTGLTMILKPIRPTWMDSVNRPYNDTEPHQTNLDGQCEQALQWYWTPSDQLGWIVWTGLTMILKPSDQLGWTVWTGLTMTLKPIRPTWMDSVNRPYNDTETHQTNLDGQCEQALQWHWNPSDQLGWTVWTGLTMTLKPIRPTWMDSVNRPYNDTEPHQTNLDGQCEQALQWYWNPSDQLGWTVWTGLTMILKPIRPTWMDSVNRPYNDTETHQTNLDGQCEQALQWYWNPSDQLGWTVWTGLTMILKPIRPTWMDSVNRPYNDTETHQTKLDGQCEQALQWHWTPSNQLGWTVWTGLTMTLKPIRPTWMDSVNRPYNDTETHQTKLDGQCEQALQWYWNPSDQLGWTVWTGLTMILNPIRPTWMDSVNRPYNDTEPHQTNLDGQCEQALQWHWNPSNQLGWTVWTGLTMILKPSDQLGWTVWTGLTMTLKPIRPTWMDSVNRPYNDTETHQTNLDGQCEQALQWYWNPSNQLGWTVWTGPYNDTRTQSRIFVKLMMIMTPYVNLSDGMFAK